jgi:signal transduction histidine kinase
VRRRAVSLRTRLTAVYGGLFLLTGAALLVVNYLLVQSRLPKATTFTQTFIENTVAPGTIEITPVTGRTPESLNLATGLVSQYRDSALSTLLLQSAIALVIMALLAAALGWLMAGRALRPLHAVTATARKLGAENLHRRINLGGPADELKELADTFDDMLERLTISFDGQKRFVANASHELRTPLAVQRTLIEVAMSDPEATLQTRQLGEKLLDANKDSELLIEGLLVLAQSDSGLESRTEVRLDEIAATVLSSSTEAAEERGVRLHSELRPCTVAGDQVLLTRLVTNLVQNGIAYNVPGGTVHLEAGPGTPLLVSNTGPDVPAEAVAGLFDPFRRLTPDRTANTHNAGLGLSIVRSIATAHGGTVDAEPGPHGGLVVSTRLPALVAT